MASAVPVVLGQAVTADFVLSQAPDAVIVATGSSPKKPAIPGGDGPRVFTVWQVLKGEAELGERVLFIDDDGAHQATSTIEYLADLGKSVHVVTTAFYIGGDLGPTQDITLSKQRLIKKGVTFTPDFYVTEIRGTEVHGIDVYSNEPKVFSDFDTIVAAMGNTASDAALLRPERQGAGALPGGRLRGAEKGRYGDPRGLHRGKKCMNEERDVIVFLEPRGGRGDEINKGILSEGKRIACLLGGKLRADFGRRSCTRTQDRSKSTAHRRSMRSRVRVSPNTIVLPFLGPPSRPSSRCLSGFSSSLTAIGEANSPHR